MRGCRKLPGGTAVHLGKSERRCGPKHSPQEEGMRQRPEQGGMRPPQDRQTD